MSKVVIIGGGVVGASVARHLAVRGGCDVTLIEQSPSPGAGSTGRATGGARVQFGTEINVRMSKYSIDFIREWDRDCGYDPKGYLFFATSEAGFDSLKRNVEVQRRVGIESTRTVSREEIAEICPLIVTDDIIGGTFGSEDSFINPIALMRSFHDEAAEHGVRFMFGTEVSSIGRVGGRVSGVITADGEIGCDAVVICTGARAARLGSGVGIAIPVRPQRRQIVWARCGEKIPDSLPMVIDVGSGFHFRPARDFIDPSAVTENGDLLLAWPDPNDLTASDDFDAGFIPPVLEQSRRRLKIHASLDVVPTKCRAGLYENTPDHHGIIGPAGPDGLFLACGFSGHGVMHSPATGRAISEMILDGRCGFMDVSALGFDRFENGRLLEESSFI